MHSVLMKPKPTMEEQVFLFPTTYLTDADQTYSSMNMGCYSLLLLNWFFQTKNIICGTIYEHPGIKISCFNNEYLIPLPAIILQEERRCLLIGDFSIEQDTDHNVSDFHDILSSNFFAPYILQPTRWAKKSKTLIDNLFQNLIEFNTFSGKYWIIFHSF